jgi:hypothetical protein
MTRFTIQVGNPWSHRVFDGEDNTLSDAIETIFPLETESAIMNWNWICIPISYKSDLSELVEDVLSMFLAIERAPKGTWKNHWISTTFLPNGL